MRCTILLTVLLLTSFSGFAAKQPPKIYIDKGACPFECCTYREWTTEKDTDLFSKIESSKIVGKAKANTTVTGVTGEVHTRPLKIKDKTGKVFFLLTYQGEGFWKVWKDGKVIKNVEQNWQSNARPTSDWWVKIKLNDGTIGWTKETKNFGNKDACGL